jgi:RNA polymerase sigma-70 factor (ECF subfamily)
VEGRPLDHDQYAELVRTHQRDALRLAFVICGNPADAADAAQEAFVKAYFALDCYRPDAPFRPWLLAIVANEARNRRRAAGRRSRYELTVDPASGGTALSPEAVVIAGADRERVAAAVAALSPRLRDVVGCRYLLGLSEVETAAALGLPAGTVKSRLARALDRLRHGGIDG